MHQTTPRFCPCGCDQSYVFAVEGTVPPRRGAELFYRCPQSQDLLSFTEEGRWVDEPVEPGSLVVLAKLQPIH